MTPGEPAVLNPIALEQGGRGENEAPGVPKGISAPSGCLKCRQFALAKAILNPPAKNCAQSLGKDSVWNFWSSSTNAG